MRILIIIFRILVGLLFIFSGLIKANDPLGFAYKLDEYWEVFGTEWLKPLSLSISIFMCALEVLLGWMLLMGSKIKLTLWLLFLMILFFAFLNFYSGYFDKVKECGCFGDAIKMTPWQEFRNNIIMLAMTIFMLIKNSHIRPLFSGIMEKFFLAIGISASIAFPLYAYNYLPVKDFRPYAIGKNIQEGMKLPPDAKPSIYKNVLYYENLKTHEVKEFDEKNYPWQDTLNWKFKDNKPVLVQKGDEPAIHDFGIVGTDGNDYTEQILNHDGYYFFLVCYDLEKTNQKVFGKVNDFAKLCHADKVPIICLTASKDQIESFKKETGTDVDFFLTDGTQLKTMIRSNPGLMLLKKGTVVDMWHYHSFPSYTDVKEKYLDKK